jgi:hypothetical protein
MGFGKTLKVELESLVSIGNELIIRTLKKSPPLEFAGTIVLMVSGRVETKVPISIGFPKFPIESDI